MKKLFYLTCILPAFLLSPSAQAQLYVDGATMVIQNGALVTVQGSVTNTGTLTNDGQLKIGENFLNSGAYLSNNNTSIVEMTGALNGILDVGNADLKNLIIQKTSASALVKLASSVQASNSFTLNNGIFNTDPSQPSFVLSSPISATYTFAAGKEVIGSVRRTGWVNGASSIFNQPNMLVTTNAGTAPTDVTVTMIPDGDPAQNEREVKRTFHFEQTGGAGFTANIRYPFASTELNTNNENNLVPWRLFNTEWNANTNAITRDAANNWVNANNISATDFLQDWKLADPNYRMNVTAYLRGSWNGSNMNTNLNTGGLIPLNQPYNEAAFNNYAGTEAVTAGFFTAHPNIVDWVLLDFRKPLSELPNDATFSNSIGRRAAFITSAGLLVDLDGVTPISVPITKQGNGFLVLKHRNHLPIMSNLLGSNAIGEYSNDYSVLANIYTNPVILSAPAQLLPASTLYGLWAGNAVKDGLINNSDVLVVKSNANVTLSGYVSGDVNLDGFVNSGDVLLAKFGANGAGQTHSYRSSHIQGAKEAITHVPQP